jgi:hypothetical protein
MFNRLSFRPIGIRIIGIATGIAAALASASIACQPSSPAEGPSRPTHLSPSEAVAVLVESRFPSATPAEAKQRLERVGEVQQIPPDASGALELRVDASTPSFHVRIVRELGGHWSFIDARTRFEAADDGAAAAAYEAYARALSNRFGPPAWTKERGPLRPLEGFRVEGGALEISLLQQIDADGLRLIQLELHEPQGEPC